MSKPEFRNSAYFIYLSWIRRSSNLTQILRSVVYILIASLLGALIFLPSSIVEEEVISHLRLI